MENFDTSKSLEGIAIIGMSGRFPGAKNIAEFWYNLQNGIESISFFSQTELESAGIPPEVVRHPQYVKSNAILENVELFDAAFFGFNPKEAEITDPQHRIFLECAWEALEQAGYDPENYKNAIGIYAGAGGFNSYFLNHLYSRRELIESVGIYQMVIGNDKDFLASRVAYKLNLTGPSITVQTACSTSLVAISMACQNLLAYECDMALAGGVAIRFPQKTGYLYQQGMVVSPDGHCRAFDAKAQGTVGGNGVGIVLLKRLADAIADGDYIHAVIKGVAINSDGSNKVGYTAPSVDGQAQVISQALAIAEVEPDTITYIETHGTGTPLGDPIEIAALKQVFSHYTQNQNFCAIGSLKTNMGHLDTAAGVAGLIKTVLALQYQMLPPSLHFEQPNPEIDFANSPFYVNTELREWQTFEHPRRAGVSSFGIGGTNAHVILEEAPAIAAKSKSRPQQLLVISARTSTALDSATKNLIEHLKQHTQQDLADVAYTLTVGRRAFEHRHIVVSHNREDVVNALITNDPKRVFSNPQKFSGRPVVFMFSGQGTQYVNMALELYHTEPTFSEVIDRCSRLLQPQLGFDLREVLYPNSQQITEAAQQLQQTALAQPALFVIEYALAQLWMSWGVQPTAMIGHSIGEYVAACLAGVFSLEDALFLVATRGQLMQRSPKGAMLAVPLPQQKLIDTLQAASLEIAAINTPSQCVVSGTFEAVNALQDKLIEIGVECRRLHTSHAFHSVMMEPILEPFTLAMNKVDLKSPTLPYISNVTGTWITAEQATNPSYWAKHLRYEVRFADGLKQLLQQPNQILLEIGPGKTLSTFAKQQDKSPQQLILTSLRHPQEEQSDVGFLLTTLGKLWLAGVQVDWSGFYTHEQRHRVPLPTYPFERQRYWIEPQKDTNISFSKQPDIADWFYIPSWKRSISPITKITEKLSWLVFIDECGLGSQLLTQLQQMDQVVTTVKVGEQFRQYGENVYTINPRKPDDYDALLKELGLQDKVPQKIVHLWNVSPNAYSEMELFEQSQDLGFWSLLFLAQALSKNNLTKPLQIVVVSNNMQEVIGAELLCPEKATLLGLIKVIAQEYPYITCKSIDTVTSESEVGQKKDLIDSILSELAEASPESVIAYRGNHRWVQTFEPVRLEKSVTEKPRLRERGVYLITGGLGGIGLVLAEYLAITVQARLILIGRTPFLETHEWEKWLKAYGAEDEISRKIQKLQALEQMGAEVLLLTADVTNELQMRSVIHLSQERFGQIHGVIHAAGVPGGGVIERKTEELAQTILAPKVKGTLVLNRIFQNVQLDFLVLCSSLASILGGFGQVDYCAANAFIDAFAQYKASQDGTYTVSINWDSWQEVGMAVNTKVSSELQQWQQHNLNRGILPIEGMDVFNRVLGSKLSQVLVSTQDFQTLAKQVNASFDSSLLKSLQRNNPDKSLHPRPELSQPLVSPKNETERKIAEIWQTFLGIEQVGIDDDFFELGGDSLLAVQILTKLRETFETSLSPHSLLQAPTISGLAQLIQQTAAQQLISPQQPKQELPEILVEIQQGNFLQPLFLVHPIGGHVYIYRDLARYLGSDVTIYGIQASGVDREIDSCTKIEDMATQYIAAVRILQPNGPYFLGGTSFGGAVAFEMAQQLNALGEKIALLALMDTPGPGLTPPKLTEDVEILAYAFHASADLTIPWDQLRQLPPDEQLFYFLEQKEIANKILPDLTPTQVRQLLHLSKVNRQAMLNYKPQKYDGEIIFFRANEHDGYSPENPELPWLELATYGVEIIEVPGNHFTMNYPPHVQVLAQKLRVYLDEARRVGTIQI